MGKTYKDRGRRRRIVKNSIYKKFLGLWGEDFHHKRKDREISRHLRVKLKREDNRRCMDEQRNII